MVKKCISYSKDGASQGNPVAMAMYALRLSVLQSELKHEKTNSKKLLRMRTTMWKHEVSMA